MHGAGFTNRKSYGPVLCGFRKSEIVRCGSVRISGIVGIVYPTVRFGAVLKNRYSHSAIRFCDLSYGPVRFGSPLNPFFYGVVQSP